MSRRHVFVTGGSGYVGRPLITRLSERGHAVRASARPGSRHKLPPTMVHLVGTPHPNPRKAQQFREVDLVSIRAAVAAAKMADVRHIVYVSVVQPAPVTREYVAVRAEGEALITAGGIPATFVRPWYVLGPGHRWPLLLLPLSMILDRLPSTRETARRLGLVTLEEMVTSLVCAVEDMPRASRVADVAAIRAAALAPR